MKTIEAISPAGDLLSFNGERLGSAFRLDFWFRRIEATIYRTDAEEFVVVIAFFSASERNFCNAWQAHDAADAVLVLHEFIPPEPMRAAWAELQRELLGKCEGFERFAH
jgi:hypothetical protein